MRTWRRTRTIVNTDPYGKGWMIRIALADGAETGELLSAEDYERMTG